MDFVEKGFLYIVLIVLVAFVGLLFLNPMLSEVPIFGVLNILLFCLTWLISFSFCINGINHFKELLYNPLFTGSIVLLYTLNIKFDFSVDKGILEYFVFSIAFLLWIVMLARFIYKNKILEKIKSGEKISYQYWLYLFIIVANIHWFLMATNFSYEKLTFMSRERLIKEATLIMKDRGDLSKVKNITVEQYIIDYDVGERFFPEYNPFLEFLNFLATKNKIYKISFHGLEAKCNSDNSFYCSGSYTRYVSLTSNGKESKDSYHEE